MTVKAAVIGAGPGGYVAAVRAAQLGAEVTIIEKENLGGTCLNWGCIPSKIMITTARMLENFHRADEFGISVEGSPAIEMAKLQKRKQGILDAQRKGIAGLLKHNKISQIFGNAYIKEPGKLAVSHSDGTESEVEWDRLIIATGTRPLNIPAFAFDGESILSSNDALSLESVPESIMIVGGGVIGCEFACILSALGAKVTIVEAMDRLLPLPSVDGDCSKILQRELKKRKVKFIVNKTVESVEKTEKGLQVSLGLSPFLKNPSEKDKKPVTPDVKKMLVCIGRRANSDNLGLENIGVETDDRGWIIADDKMKTSAENVYAIGDILGPPRIMLAHVASTEGEVAAENLMGGDKTMDYSVVPGGIFTEPEVGNVGLTEAQAKEQGINVRSDAVNFRSLGKAQVIGEIAGQAKIVSDADSGKILGVHIIGPHATDLIAEGTLAVKNNITVRELAETIHAHPTLAEIMLEAAFKANDQPLHA